MIRTTVPEYDRQAINSPQDTQQQAGTGSRHQAGMGQQQRLAPGHQRETQGRTHYWNRERIRAPGLNRGSVTRPTYVGGRRAAGRPGTTTQGSQVPATIAGQGEEVRSPTGARPPRTKRSDDGAHVAPQEKLERDTMSTGVEQGEKA